MKTEGKKKKAELNHAIKSLKEELCTRELQCAEANEAVESLLDSEEVVTFENGKYRDDIRSCIYELLSLNVGINVSPIIKSVLKNVVHKTAKRLPSYGLICNMMTESLAIVQAQLGQELADHCPGFSTLQTDGTTKWGIHYSAFDIQVPETNDTYALGLRHVFSGSASDTLSTFKEILEDLDTVRHQLGEKAVSQVIVMKIKNTMSDRHAAEKLFNRMLEDFRGEILPMIVEKWEDMTLDEREQLERMNNFFCGLHFLVGLADSAEETLKLWEAQHQEGSSGMTSSTSGTQRLVRTACKLFHHRGSQQCSFSVQFRAYLRKKGIHKVPLAQFVGNRFNILFYDGAGVYYLKSHMLEFIRTVHGGNANLLAKAVQKDLMNPVHIAGCRALGIIDKLVTGPLWRKIQESSMSILSISNVYTNLLLKFMEWSNDAQQVIEGVARIQDDMIVHLDEVFDDLLQPRPDRDINGSGSLDELTLEVLQLIFQAFSQCTKRLLHEHLPGGEFHSTSQLIDTQLVNDTSSVPLTNTAPERNFALYFFVKNQMESL